MGQKDKTKEGSGQEICRLQKRIAELEALNAEHKRVGDSLSSNVRRFEQLLENSFDNIVILDANGIQRYVSRSVERTLGYKPSELINIPVIEQMIHPDDYENVKKAFSQVIVDGQGGGIQYRHRHKNGGWVYLEAWGTNQLDNPDIKGVLVNCHAITDRKQAEMDLRQKESQFRELFDNMSDGVAIYQAKDNGEDFIFLGINKAAERLSKVGREEIIGQSVLEAFPGVREIGLFEVFQKVWKTGASQHHPISLYQDARITQWVENYVYKLPSGEIVAVYADITERKQAEEALRESNELLSLFMKKSPIYSYIKDVTSAQNIVVCASDNFKEMIGLKEGDLVGKNMTELFSPEFAAKIMADDWAVIASGEVYRCEEEFNGRTYNTIKFPIVLGDKTLLAGYTIDVTEIRQINEQLSLNERRFRLATQSGNIGVWDWDVLKNELSWDDSMYFLYGIRKEDFAGAYEAWMGTLHPDDRLFVDGEIQAALRGDREYAPEFRIVRSNGEIRNIQATSQCLRDPKGKVTRMIGTNIDITERKKVEEIFKKAKEDAEAATKAKSEFLNNIAHDFRTPIHAIQGFSSYLQAESVTERQKKFISFINESSKNLLRLVEDLLDVSKLTSGKIELRSVEFDLNKSVTDAVAMARIGVMDKPVTLLCVLPDSLPRVKGDDIRYRQILDNLISNAIKYTDHGQVTVTVNSEYEGCPEGKCRVRISVKDTGLGIPKEKQSRIFDAFTRFHEFEGGKERGGVGMGLYIVKTLVDLMKGTTSVVSEVGQGSEFIVLIDLDLA
jgi:PAS domain S-box-containing protein